MYTYLLVFHAWMRWLLLAALLYAIYRAYTGYRQKRPFTPLDNTLRHTTATLAHVQLAIGVVLYIKSPLVKYILAHFKQLRTETDMLFFSALHPLAMLTAVVVLTIGSAVAKRQTDSQTKFNTMLWWYGIALFIILAAVPWPFSPLAGRPYFRNF